MNNNLLSIRPTYLLIKSSIINLLSYLSHELNYIYIKSKESDEFEFDEFDFDEFGLECYLENDKYPNSTTKYEKEDNNDTKNNWGLWVFTEEYDIKNEV